MRTVQSSLVSSVTRTGRGGRRALQRGIRVGKAEQDSLCRSVDHEDMRKVPGPSRKAFETQKKKREPAKRVDRTGETTQTEAGGRPSSEDVGEETSRAERNTGMARIGCREGVAQAAASERAVEVWGLNQPSHGRGIAAEPARGRVSPLVEVEKEQQRRGNKMKRRERQREKPRRESVK